MVSGRLAAKGYLDPAPLYALARKHLGGQTVLGVPVYVVASDYVTQKMAVFGPGTDAADMALSTSAIPVLFPAYNDRYMDGGCVQNAPYPYLLDACGCTKIMVLYCDPDPDKLPCKVLAPDTIKTGVAALGAFFSVQEMMAYNDLEKTKVNRKLQGLDDIEVDHYYPSDATGSLLGFEDNHRTLQQGYDVAVKYMTPDKLKAFLV